MGSHLCTGSPWVKSVLTHGQLLIPYGLILPVGSMPTAHWRCCSRPCYWKWSTRSGVTLTCVRIGQHRRNVWFQEKILVIVALVLLLTFVGLEGWYASGVWYTPSAFGTDSFPNMAQGFQVPRFPRRMNGGAEVKYVQSWIAAAVSKFSDEVVDLHMKQKRQEVGNSHISGILCSLPDLGDRRLRVHILGVMKSMGDNSIRLNIV